jgi:hypothetical protein
LRQKRDERPTSASSFFFSFLGLLGALAFFSTLVFSFLKGARSLESKLGLLERSSFLGASASADYNLIEFIDDEGGYKERTGFDSSVAGASVVAGSGAGAASAAGAAGSWALSSTLARSLSEDKRKKR